MLGSSYASFFSGWVAGFSDSITPRCIRRAGMAAAYVAVAAGAILLGFSAASMKVASFAPTPAWAANKAEEGVPVKVVVLDEQKKPIPTAVIRHPLEQDRHRVNSVDGSWETSVLYMPDGTELRFTPGMTLDLEISAPGYTTQVFQYQVRKRRNVIEVKLAAIELENDTIEEPMITFGRDEPREPAQE